jgi:hypothetical protein
MDPCLSKPAGMVSAGADTVDVEDFAVGFVFGLLSRVREGPPAVTATTVRGGTGARSRPLDLQLLDWDTGSSGWGQVRVTEQDYQGAGLDLRSKDSLLQIRWPYDQSRTHIEEWCRERSGDERCGVVERTGGSAVITQVCGMMGRGDYTVAMTGAA